MLKFTDDDYDRCQVMTIPHMTLWFRWDKNGNSYI